MRISVERLRIGLLVGAGLLLVVIAAFLGYARYKIRHTIANLPGRLGATITKEFNGYTYSQSDGKRTIFTIHAAKAIQHTDGTYTLRDVNMVLYGKAGNRADHISGDDFEYNTKAEEVRAIGVVHIDLEAPAPDGAPESDARKHLGPSAGDAEHADTTQGNRIVHVKTSGLVYQKKLAVAATNQEVEFAFNGYTGHAVGAEYDSDTGHVILQSAIAVSGVDKGHPVALTASHGELDRTSNEAQFSNARYSSAGQVAQADAAQMHMRADGGVERIDAERHVKLEGEGQGVVNSDRAEIELSLTNKPKSAVLTGAVRFTEDEPLKQARGESERARLEFDEQGHLNHAEMHGGVHTFERLKVVGNETQPWSERNLNADNLEMTLAVAVAGGKPELRDARASGSAHLSSVAPSTKSGACAGNVSALGKCSGSVTTKLSGDELEAHFIAARGTSELSTVHGAGHTVVEQTGATGIDQTSSGAMLDAKFREAAGGKGAVELASAVQQGAVVIDRTSPAKKPAEAQDVQHATGQMAAYDANSDRLMLTGNVHMNDAASGLWAERVVMEQDSGDATADGGVKVSYLQQGSAEPVHVLATRAELNHDAGRATFYGRAMNGSAGLARMWQAGADGQGGSQIEAPMLVFEQAEKRLTARSEKMGEAGQVHAALASAASKKQAEAPAKDLAKTLSGKGVARITSSRMVYSDADRQAVFTGGVRVLDGDGEMRSEQATVFLFPADAGKAKPGKAATTARNPGASATGLLGGSVEQIVATQHIEITQPGRRATGERLVYTASDQMFVLTGTAAVPPKVVDAQQGTTTGAALRFHSGDNSVVVSGRDGDAPVQKVHTETRVKQ